MSAIAVGALGIIAGTLCWSYSSSFSQCPVCRVGPSARSVDAASIRFCRAAADLTFGVGELTAKRWAFLGMIVRSLIGVPIHCVYSPLAIAPVQWFGLAVNVFVVEPIQSGFAFVVRKGGLVRAASAAGKSNGWMMASY